MDYEKEARAMGWVEKEEFRDDPEKWVDAKTFVEKGKNIMPILKENLDRALSKLERLEAERAADRERFAKFEEFASKAEERAHKKAEANYKKQLRTLKTELKKAAKSGDWDTYETLESDLDTLEKPEPPKPAPTPPSNQEPPEFIEWKKVNSWYDDDYELRALADSMAQYVKATKPHIRDNKTFFEEVGKEVKKTRPDKFETKELPPGPEGGSEAPPSGKKKTFKDIPIEDQKQFEEFKQIMPEYTKEKFAKQYWEE